MAQLIVPIGVTKCFLRLLLVLIVGFVGSVLGIERALASQLCTYMDRDKAPYQIAIGEWLSGIHEFDLVSISLSRHVTFHTADSPPFLEVILDPLAGYRFLRVSSEEIEPVELFRMPLDGSASKNFDYSLYNMMEFFSYRVLEECSKIFKRFGDAQAFNFMQVGMILAGCVDARTDFGVCERRTLIEESMRLIRASGWYLENNKPLSGFHSDVRKQISKLRSVLCREHLSQVGVHFCREQ